MTFQPVSLKSGRRSPAAAGQHQAGGRQSPSGCKKSKLIFLNNNNNNVVGIAGCCGGHRDTQQQRVTQRCSSDASSSSSTPTFLERRSGLAQTALFLVCVAVYWNSLPCDFVFDDVTAIRDNRDLRPHVPVRNLLRNDFWGTPMHREQSHKSYRPLTVLTFRWNYAAGGLQPVGYHAVNVVLHGVVSVVYFNVCRKVATSAVAFLAAMLFALHPVREDLLMAKASSVTRKKF
jgi:hypothetical protein